MAEPREHRIRVTRSARYYTLGPADDDGATDVTELWLACHGYRQLARRFILPFAALDDGHRRVVAPEGLSRFYIDEESGPHGPESRVGATWMTREDRESEIGDYIAYLDEVHERVSVGLDPARARVVALGFSQGAATASRWATLGQSRVDRLVLWASRLPPDLPMEQAAERLRRLRPVYVIGERDPYVHEAAVAAEAARLDAHGIPYSVIHFDGEHRLDAEALRRVAEHIRGETD